MDSTRTTFVIHVRDGDGPATVQEVRTGRQARLSSLRDAAGQIERWLRDTKPPTERSGEADDVRHERSPRWAPVLVSWAKVAGASEYLVEVKAGAETLYRVLTPKRRLRFAAIPEDGKLKLTVQAVSEIQPPGPVAKLTAKPAKG